MSSWTVQLGAAERGINRVLALDPEFLEGLAALDGKQIDLEIVGLGLTVRVTLHPGGVRLGAVDPSVPEGAADVSLRGSPFALARLLLARDDGTAVLPEGVTVGGDIGLLQALREQLARLHVDWEEELARVFGDTVAHELARGLRGLWRWGCDVGDKMADDGAEFVREELRLTPPRYELESFAEEVEDARDAVERLAQRIERLRRRRGRSSP